MRRGPLRGDRREIRKAFALNVALCAGALGLYLIGYIVTVQHSGDFADNSNVWSALPLSALRFTSV
jgi:hypothetical protein